MTIHKTLHPKVNVDRVYVSIKERKGGLASIEDSVDASILQLKDYIEKYEGILITETIGRCKRIINNISYEKTWTWLRKRNILERNIIS